MQKEDGVTGAGNRIYHLFANSGVARTMGPSLNTWPKRHEIRRVHTRVHHGGGRQPTCRIADPSRNTMIGDSIARAYGVGIVGKRAVLDTLRGGYAVSAKTEDRVENIGFGKGANVNLFFPVRLAGGISAFALQSLFVGVQEEAVEGEELALNLISIISHHVIANETQSSITKRE